MPAGALGADGLGTLMPPNMARKSFMVGSVGGGGGARATGLVTV
jgi:hypothetical protein